jgi:hypothetical protein
VAEVGKGERVSVAVAEYLSEKVEEAFPNLRRDAYRVTSEADWKYNCIAHAADKSNQPWWPTEEEVEGVYWPTGAPREETLAAFIAAYATEGYAPCEGPEYEEGFEKVAIYADSDGVPTHAAKLLAPDAWTSKLGEAEDIEHKTLDCLSGQEYGRPVQFMKRRRRNSPTPEQVQPSEGQKVEDRQAAAIPESAPREVDSVRRKKASLQPCHRPDNR